MILIDNKDMHTDAFLVNPDYKSSGFELVPETQNGRLGAVIVADEDVLCITAAAAAAAYDASHTTNKTNPLR